MSEVRLDEQHVAVARVYAQALLGLAGEKGQEHDVLEELEVMLEHFDRQPGFEAILGDPAVDETARAEILERVLRDRANDLLTNTLQVMNRKGRSGLIRHLAEAYRDEVGRLDNQVEATATTAVPLSDDNRARLVEALARFTGKKVMLEEKVDDSLIAGMVLRIGDQKIDSSVARELWRVGSRLDERASDELSAAMTEN